MVKIFYPKYMVKIENKLSPTVYVCHHQNLFGPFVTLLWFPASLHVWALHVFLDRHACYQHYVNYTFTERYKWNKVIAKICAYPFSYIISHLLNSGKAIPVYRGSRKIIKTFNQSIDILTKGESIVICPDIDYRDPSSITKNMYDGFLYLEKYYYQKTGKHLCFTPLYVSKNKKEIRTNQSIYFRDGDFNAERRIVYEKIRTGLNELAFQCEDVDGLSLSNQK